MIASLNQLEVWTWMKKRLPSNQQESKDQSNAQPVCSSNLKTLGLGILREFW